MGTVFIETPRLILRAWEDEDRAAFAEMNSSVEVMRYFPATLSAEELDRFVDRIVAEFEEFGHGLYAVELKETGEFIGYVGFHRFCFDAPFSPGWEIGWRLSDRFWHRGLATKAASACLDYARTHHLFDRVYSFTATLNRPSENVMKRLGMTCLGSFMHPALPDAHPLKEHRLYALDL